jgi:hypothetical protein
MKYKGLMFVEKTFILNLSALRIFTVIDVMN